MQTPQIQQEIEALPQAVLPFLPLLYIAWSDELLTPTEVAVIRRYTIQQPWLSQTDKQWLSQRLDVNQPPTPQQLKSWLILVARSAQSLTPPERKNLVALSMRLANLGTEHLEGEFKSDRATEALQEIQEALGIQTHEAVKAMLKDAHLAEPKAKVPEYQPTFDPARLHVWLDGPHKALKDRVRMLLTDPFFSFEKIPPTKEAYREQVLIWLKTLAEHGLGGLAYPKEVGGADDMGQYLAVFEMLGHGDLSVLVKYGVQFGLFGGAIMGLGTQRHHERYLPGAASLDLPGCFAMTEAGHGSNVRDLETTASYDPADQTFTIHTPHYYAHKAYIGNAAAHAKLAVVFAQLETLGESYGVHAFVVPIRDESGQPMPGVTIGDSGRKLGLNGVDNGRLWFDQVKVPQEALLDRFASVSSDGTYRSPIPSEGRRFFTMLGTLVGGRVGVPLAGLSAAKSGLAIAIKYATKRRQFGRAGEPEMPIMEYRTHQRRLLPLLAKTYALHTAHRYMVDRFVNRTEGDEREVEALAAGLKAISTWHTSHTLQECREATGGQGYLAVNRFADLRADTDIFTTFEGDNTVLLQLVAKAKLSEFSAGFRSMNFFGLMNFLANKAVDNLAEKNPISIRRTDPEHLRDLNVLLDSCKRREEVLVYRTARQLKSLIDAGMDSYDAFIEVQLDLMVMARAYIDHVILSQFIAAIEQVEDEGEQAILTKLCQLYGLSELEANLAWYMEEGYIEGSRAKAIREQVDGLCQELKPEASALVDAFGIPDALLAAPIALSFPDLG